MGSALLAIDTSLVGPNYSILTACTTANYCFYAAASHIRIGEADIMVAEGTEAAIIPTGVNYVNAYATSALAGDLARVNAIKKVFKNTLEMKMNVKSGPNNPSCLWNLESEVTIDTVPNVKKQHEVNVGISNSLGFGGYNSVVAFAPLSLKRS
ncbi:3-oxoacyl-[acyl-carrier- ] synthase I, chloroplastic-like [Olea europaea subsp. europaea]|uniref:beta-ketoacyl-[acyl-carrier-protein] synthase I n=1 Tax=Olea europaea subsp. europaea TaxID=158383 RepID=A0A8S0USH1_OLEEU|nr:3-oxoacyl-[acyl-carrier- ] synthase I, chloroplastic-like [Olea europaea subsp. europaea]